MTATKRDHNFKAIEGGKKTLPGMQRWHCKDCDTIVEFPIKYNQRAINRIMANKMLCLQPIYN